MSIQFVEVDPLSGPDFPPEPPIQPLTQPLPPVGWPEFDASLLDEARVTVPAFPLQLLPEAWRQWVTDTAQQSGAPSDYVAQGLLAAVAGIGGAGVRVKVASGWTEPLVLWLSLVGSPSSGKSPALASVRALLGEIERQLRERDPERRAEHAARLEEARLAQERWQKACTQAAEAGDPLPRRPAMAEIEETFVPGQIVVADATMEALADVVQGNPRGVVLWRDELTAWLANLGRYASGGSDRAHWLEAWSAAGITVNRRSRRQPMQLPKFPVSVVGSIQPDRLGEAFQGSDDGMAARFLYAWPEPPKYRSILERREARDGDALAMLQHIAGVVGTAEQPLTLALDPDTAAFLDGFCERLHEDALLAEGLEAGWLGKGRGTVVRLAGVLTLLDWSGNGRQEAPDEVIETHMRDAIELWSGYFRPQARAVFTQCGRTDRDRLARRAVKWLRASAYQLVGREDLRRDALGQSIDAAETDRLIARLEQGGVLRLHAVRQGAKGGRSAKRWQVNPAINE